MTIYRNEGEFKSDLKLALESDGFHLQRHEDKYETGIPDMSYGKDGINGWIETKWLKLRFEPKQPLWLSKRAQTGGSVFVILGLLDGAQVIDFGMMHYWNFEGPVSLWKEPLTDLLTLPTDLERAVYLHQRLPPSFGDRLQAHLLPGPSTLVSLPDRSVP